ncbi:ficolin-2-like [Physella acuta]|uniref:ficolin-2-like n=1 Tax=Physella acuta TaxID=109671 RepID=UPI0027DE6B37|nr:ficolin-2-like [Physella acuta]
MYNIPFDVTGSWLVPLKSSDRKVQGKIWSSGKFCNTTRNIKVLSDGSISKHDLYICTGKRELCLGVESSDPRPLVTLSSGLQVMCDTVTDGGGWTIFQRRVSGTVNFTRNWTEYKNGFGDFSSGNIWLGNEKLNNLTTANRTELRVDMVFNGTSYFAKYSNFYISSEADGYRLHVGNYTGNAGRDDLRYHDDMKFSTFDVDNDFAVNGSCAIYGGWWLNNCYFVHLNGVWSATGFQGIRWLSISNDPLSFTEMKFRYF